MKTLRWTGWLLAASAVLGLLAWSYRLELAAAWVNRGLDRRLAEQLGPGASVQGAAWRGGTLSAERVTLEGGRWPFERLDLAGVAMPLGWEDLRGGLKSLRQITVEEATLTRRAAGDGTDGGAAPQDAPPLDLVVERFHVNGPDDASWAARDLRLRAVLEGGAASLSAAGGTLSVPGWPGLRIERVSSDRRGGRWEVGGFAVNDGGGGALGGSAREAPDGSWSAEFSWRDLDIAQFLGAATAEHVTGRCEGDAVLEDGILHGRMKVTGAEVRAVPPLVRMAGLFDGENWTVVPWDKVEFQFARGPDGRVSFYDLDARSPKGLVVRGEGVVATDVLSAQLELGVHTEGRPWLLAFMPVLFRSKEEGLLWTTVRLGGTPSAPTEDLSPRVVAALAAVPARQAAEAAEAAAQIPGGAVEAVEAAGSLLRGLLRP